MNLEGPGGRTDSWRLLELIAVLTLAMSVLGLVAARLGVFHVPQLWIIGLLMTYAYARLARPVPSAVSERAPWWHLLLVVAVGLMFRLTPFAYIMGGQDQGVYANMAMELVRSGGLSPVDPILASITDSTVLETYRAGNYQPTIYLPGIYNTAGGLEFQFYHLFPVWLALFGGIFGVQGGGYGLTLLSIVSLLFFQRLAHLISGRAAAGLVAGLLLAVNPLHAFFSKFTVTEVPTLAFSTISFAFLVNYWRAPAPRSGRQLVISVLALGLLFLTRISGFMYLPFVFAISTATALLDADHDRRRGMLAWSAGVIALYVFSVLDGLEWSHVYATDIYRMSFAPLLGRQWISWLLALSAAGVFAFGAVCAFGHKEGMRRAGMRVLPWVRIALPLLALLLAAVALYKAHRLGFTDAYVSDPVVGKRFGIAGQGYRSVFSISLVASMVYLSPFIFLAFFIAGFRAVRDPVLLALLFFVVCFLGHIVLMQWNLPYQPYYARYLLSEFVPYALLLVVCTWASLRSGKLKGLLAVMLVMGGLYGLAVSALQVGKSEHGGVLPSIEKVAAHFDDGDLVIVDRALRSPSAPELKTALAFTYGLNVATMTEAELADSAYFDGLVRPFHDVYFLTRDAYPPTGFSMSDSVRFSESAFRHGVMPPIATWMRGDSRLYIHRYGMPSRGRVFGFGSGQSGTALLVDGWSSPESWGVWTSGRTARLNLDPSRLGTECLDAPLIRLSGRVYNTPKHSAQRVRVVLNGALARDVVATLPDGRLEMELPLPQMTSPSGLIELDIETPDAVSPADLGYSMDRRMLGFGLEALKVEGKPAVRCP